METKKTKKKGKEKVGKKEEKEEYAGAEVPSSLHSN